MDAPARLAKLRVRQLEVINHMLLRPLMFASCDSDFVSMVSRELELLQFIDEIESTKAEFHRILYRGLQPSPCGIANDLKQFFSPHQVIHVAASLFLPVLVKFGFFESKQLDSKSWKSLRAGLPRLARSKDMQLSEVYAEHGEPAFATSHVATYVGPDLNDDWIFIDLFGPHGENPSVGAIRLPTKSFSRGLVFTPFGKSYMAARFVSQDSDLS